MKIPKRINVKTALIFVAIGILITSGLFYVFAATPSSPMYIGSGPYPGAPSYTIWREGSNYFAKDANGLLPSWSGGTNISDITQKCENTFTTDGGGTIHYAKGIFTFDTAVSFDTHLVKITGEGLATQLNTVENITMFNVTAKRGYMTFENFRVRHYGHSGSFIKALSGIFHSRFVNLHIDNGANFEYAGCVFNFSGSGFNTFENYFDSCTINIALCHLWYWGSELFIQNCKFGHQTPYGKAYVKIINSGNINIDNTGFEVVKLWFETVDNVNLDNLWFTGAPNHAVYAYSVSNMTINNLVVKHVYNMTDSPPGAGLYGLRFYSESSDANCTNILMSNVLVSINTTGVGISIEANCSYVTIINCDTSQCTTKGIMVASNLKQVYVGNSWNLTTWIAIEGEKGDQGPPGTLEGEQPYSYLVFRNATSTYMINGETGDIDFNGSPSATINNALGNATDTVLLCGGTYTLTGDTGLTIGTNDVVLRGMGYSTSLECDAGFDDHIIHVTANYVTICDLQIDGTNQAASYHGILEDGNGNGGLFVHHVRIRDCGGDGIRLGDTDASWEGNWAKIHHVVIQDNGVYGIHFTYDATDSELLDFLISGHDGVGDAGINVGCDNIRINTGHLWGNEYEMKIAEDDYSGKGSVNGLIVSNVGFMDGGEQGAHRIYHAGSKNFINSVFSGCEIWVAKLSGVDTYDGFYLAGDTWCISITGCVFRGDNETDTKQGRYGIFMDASVHNCTIVSNTFEGFCQADPIQTTGASNLQEGYNVVYNCG